MANSQSELGNRLKEIRTRNNYTQADLAALVEVSRKTINTVENRVFIPSTVLALKLSQALNVSVEELFYLVDSKAE
ncbi:helix-turn-helix transcriptional regulator [Pleionea mediterranea]|uniref:Putative transcriptional regulator n=1 Tax=Pleionea mediterranea TaxID=523701 RepID=A0A316FED4_9GAMM|nr:helix-turn-helix transcriptional regulator [Pleionea mediterranea]PWK45410.1 putative transcriptional regulator [Pleionea mediterranea]